LNAVREMVIVTVA